MFARPADTTAARNSQIGGARIRGQNQFPKIEEPVFDRRIALVLLVVARKTIDGQTEKAWRCGVEPAAAQSLLDLTDTIGTKLIGVGWMGRTRPQQQADDADDDKQAYLMSIQQQPIIIRYAGRCQAPRKGAVKGP